MALPPFYSLKILRPDALPATCWSNGQPKLCSMAKAFAWRERLWNLRIPKEIVHKLAMLSLRGQVDPECQRQSIRDRYKTGLPLAIDTTQRIQGLALAEGDLAEEVALHSPDGFAHVMFPEIEALLARHKITDVEALNTPAGDVRCSTQRPDRRENLVEATGRKSGSPFELTG